MADEVFQNAEGSTGSLKNGVFEAFKSQSEADSKTVAAEPLEQMTAQEVLDAVDSGEVSKADAVAAENKRSAPRKTVTEGL